MLSKGARNIEIYRAYKFRLYPKLMNKKILIYKTFGCKRFVYNYYLNYLKENKSKTKFDLHKDLSKLKEVDSCVLCSAVDNLVDSFNNYYAKKISYPKFKSKFGKQSFIELVV